MLDQGCGVCGAGLLRGEKYRQGTLQATLCKKRNDGLRPINP